MQVGLIPPRGLENYALRSKFHLALAIPDLMSRRAYGGMYMRLARLGDFVVLDNGIAEGQPSPPESLMAQAATLGAQEVVAPDVMKDANATIKAVEDFFKLERPARFQYMAVVQGEKVEDFFKCADVFASIESINTLGIPRHMLTTLNQKAARIDFAYVVDERYPGRFDLHLLGTNPMWIPEVKHAAKYSPFIRSVDTSMPFSYALAGQDLALTTEHITRPDRYFDIDWPSKVDGPLIRSNIRTFMEWADATSIRSQASASKLRDVSTS